MIFLIPIFIAKNAPFVEQFRSAVISQPRQFKIVNSAQLAQKVVVGIDQFSETQGSFLVGQTMMVTDGIFASALKWREMQEIASESAVTIQECSPFAELLNSDLHQLSLEWQKSDSFYINLNISSTQRDIISFSSNVNFAVCNIFGLPIAEKQNFVHLKSVSLIHSAIQDKVFSGIIQNSKYLVGAEIVVSNYATKSILRFFGDKRVNNIELETNNSQGKLVARPHYSSIFVRILSRS